tara:strand:+ start:1447 stop:2151 length:705 start_codon:yes stop_codon:yes gene_type:complete
MFNLFKKTITIEQVMVNHAIFNKPLDNKLGDNEESIVFGCGCFWGAEKGFWRLPGVTNTAVGYAGGEKPDPTYNQVCGGRTGHTEVVKVTWDKRIIGLSDLLKLFWECHDPTQGNRQGNDRGSQYRSAIFTETEKQIVLVLASKNKYQENLKDNGFNEITTEIKLLNKFYYAEDYHQQYLAKPNARQYCSAMPTKTILNDFTGSNYMLPEKVWANYDWETSHCILRGDNSQIII